MCRKKGLANILTTHYYGVPAYQRAVLFRAALRSGHFAPRMPPHNGCPLTITNAFCPNSNFKELLEFFEFPLLVNFAHP
jgi:hypothetical protein